MPTGPHGRLAAIVLNFRTPDETVMAVRSLLASTRPPDDLIVVDNDKGAGCRFQVAELGSSVHYLSTGSNLGFSGGMNVGIRAALASGANAVLLVNSDATLTPDCLERLERGLDGQVGIVGPVIRRAPGEHGLLSAGIDYEPSTGRMHERQSAPRAGAIVAVDAVSGCVMLVAATVFASVGLLDDDYFFSFEDIDLCLRARAAGFSTVVVADANAHHHGSRTMGADSPRRLYFAARNHLLLASRAARSSGGAASMFRVSSIVALNAAHAMRSRHGTLKHRLSAVVRGTRDYQRGRFGEGDENRPLLTSAGPSAVRHRTVADHGVAVKKQAPSAPTFEGNIESPTSIEVDATHLNVSGWVFCRQKQIRGLRLQVDNEQAVAVPYGSPRPDVAAGRNAPGHLRSGFGVQIPFDFTERSTVTLALVAVFDEGPAVECLVRTLQPLRGRDAGSLRQANHLVRSALIKLRLAIRDRRLPWSPLRWANLLVQHWREASSHPSTRVRRPEKFDPELLNRSYRGSQLINGGVPASRPLPMVPLSIVALIGDAEWVPQLVQAVESMAHDGWHLWLITHREAGGIAAAVATHARQPDRMTVTDVRSLLRPDGTWLPPGDTEYCVLMDHTVVPADQVLNHVASFLEGSSADWIYTDDDLRDTSGIRSDPHLKGGVSPELALTDDYMTRLAIVRRGVLVEVGGFRSDAGQAQIYDLLLRVLETTSTVEHLPVIGCHRRERGASVLGEDHQRAVERALVSRVRASFRVVERSSPSGHDFRAVVWPEDVVASLDVTIVIPTRDRVGLLARCIDSLNRTVPSRVPLIVVDDHSREPATAEYLRWLEQERSRSCRILRPGGPDDGFNYARLMNMASREVATPIMLHLNNDIEAIAPGWLEQMIGWLTVDGIGVVGAKLLDRHGSIDHAGVMVSPDQGMLDHMFARLKANDPGYQWLPHRLRNVSAVTGACLLTRTDDFCNLGGFDEEHLRVQFNDVDYCLRVIASGKRVVYEPAAVLYHDVSASRGLAHDYRETAFFLEKYRSYREPFVSQYFEARSISGPTPRLLPSVQRRRIQFGNVLHPRFGDRLG